MCVDVLWRLERKTSDQNISKDRKYGTWIELYYTKCGLPNDYFDNATIQGLNYLNIIS